MIGFLWIFFPRFSCISIIFLLTLWIDRRKVGFMILVAQIKKPKRPFGEGWSKTASRLLQYRFKSPRKLANAKPTRRDRSRMRAA